MYRLEQTWVDGDGQGGPYIATLVFWAYIELASECGERVGYRRGERERRGVERHQAKRKVVNIKRKLIHS